MTPDFALLLSEDGIVLLQRRPDAGGWVQLGDVAVDDPNLNAGLHGLSEIAQKAAGGPFSTKLILPESQLLYLDVSVSRNADADIRAALEDRTPYRAEDLIYDVSGTGAQRQVVSVALETLSEATGFLAPYPLSPVGFTSIPAQGVFEGEPNLGSTEGQTFVPDTSPVVIVEARDETPAPGPQPETEITETTHTAAPAPTDDVPKDTPAHEDTAPDTPSTPETPPAAFSSRRRSDPAEAQSVAERLGRRTPRIAVPSKNAPARGAKTPKVAAPTKTLTATEPSSIKASTPAKAVPTIIPAAIAPSDALPKSVVAKPSLKDRLRKPKARPAQDPLPDPIAAFAAKKSTPAKPKYLGLVLTAALIALLGLFAVTSSFLLPLSQIASKDTDETEAVSVADQTAPDLDLAPNSDTEEFDVANLPPQSNADTTLPDFAQDAPPNFGSTAPLLESPDAREPETPAQDTTQVTQQVPKGPLSETEAETRYAVTGIWQRAPDFSSVTQEDILDDLYVASLDPSPVFSDSQSLPNLNAPNGDDAISAPKDPPPPGVFFDLDTRGLVRATPAGAINPEGITVTLGRPPVMPIQRDESLVPSDLAPAILDPTEVAPRIATETPAPRSVPQADPDLPFADPALAGFSPRQRPANIAERAERLKLGGYTLSELAARRPSLRPEAVIAAARVAAREAAKAAEDARIAAEQKAKAQSEAIAAAVEEAAKAEAAAIALAAASIPKGAKPAPRPRNFDRIVARAKKPDVQTASASTASAGPAVARGSRVRPSGPTTNSVARAATDNNAISLGQVSLVGVFGTSSNRRALVRLPSGRFKKVSIGDRVDGGRVAAIGASELRYTKSGRTLTLTMPKG